MLQRQAIGTPARRMPRHWLMADARFGPDLARAIARMPPRGGVIIRPYALAPQDRARTVRAARYAAHARRHWVLISDRLPRAGFAGRHGGAGQGRRQRADGVLSLPVHNMREARQSRRARANLVFVSPLFATASHAGAPALGQRRFAMLAAMCGAPVIALGGMDPQRFRIARRLGAYGWAGISCWT